MHEASQVASEASEQIERFLKQLPETVSVKNVEKNESYQKADIDLLWSFRKEKKTITKTIEIKADRHYHTGNYFFETTSNTSKGTPGCFMYSQANYLFYYFTEVKELHVLPMKIVRNWFCEHQAEFPLKQTSTKLPNNRFYITEGRLVPRVRVKKELHELKIVRI